MFPLLSLSALLTVSTLAGCAPTCDSTAPMAVVEISDMPPGWSVEKEAAEYAANQASGDTANSDTEGASECGGMCNPQMCPAGTYFSGPITCQCVKPSKEAP